MGAAIAKVGMSLLGASGLTPQKAGQDAAIATVKAGRVAYIGSASSVALLWYFAWRNERVDQGSGSFPIPGLFKGDIKHPEGAPDASDADPIVLVPVLGNAAPGGSTGGGQVQPQGTGDMQTNPQPRSLTGNQNLLVRLGDQSKHFGIIPTEHPKFGGVHPVHVKNSWHYKGRAIDFDPPGHRVDSAALHVLSVWAKYLVDNYQSDLIELIWAGPGQLAVSNGKIVNGASFYSGTWANHKTHVHVAM